MPELDLERLWATWQETLANPLTHQVSVPSFSPVGNQISCERANHGGPLLRNAVTERTGRNSFLPEKEYQP